MDSSLNPSVGSGSWRRRPFIRDHGSPHAITCPLGETCYDHGFDIGLMRSKYLFNFNYLLHPSLKICLHVGSRVVVQLGSKLHDHVPLVVMRRDLMVRTMHMWTLLCLARVSTLSSVTQISFTTLHPGLTTLLPESVTDDYANPANPAWIARRTKPPPSNTAHSRPLRQTSSMLPHHLPHHRIW